MKYYHKIVIQYISKQMSIQISKTRNEHKRYLSFMKEAGIQHPNIISNESIFSIPEEVQVITTTPQIKVKSKRGRKKKNPESIEVPILKKMKINEKEIQKETEHFNTVYANYEAQYKEMEQKAFSMINCNQFKQKNIEPNTNDSEVSMPISSNQIIKQESQNHHHNISRYIYPDCVNKSNNHFYGYLGHTTVLTSSPVIEGTYFIEVKILSHSINKQNKAWRDTQKWNFRKYDDQQITAVRVGIAKRDYHVLTPLGGECSYALKGIDGSLINNKKTIKKSESIFGIGDVIGILLHMEAPIPTDKNQKKKIKPKQVINKGSHLQFFKNGVKISEIFDLDQQYYVFGVSMYNWTNVEINQGPQFRFHPKTSYKAYSGITSESLIYKDLKFLQVQPMT